jgi:hypothetical protein
VASPYDPVRNFPAVAIHSLLWNPAQKVATGFFITQEVSMSDYKQMWSDPGLNLKARDMLLSVPGKTCRETFFSKKDHSYPYCVTSPLLRMAGQV